ncbi:permease of the major facilitator superfamily [Xylogone sp. PMI_703]|nr:permease of the major facilitator superfamily [Xylogone sp. PMI_703]
MDIKAVDTEKGEGGVDVMASEAIHVNLKGAKEKDVDMAMQLLAMADCNAAEIAAVDHKKLVRKIDLRLMPIMFFAILLFSLDKLTLSYSSVMGIQKSRNLTSDQYSWLGSIFSLGYLVANIPCAVIIQKVPLSKWIVFTMSIWGTILCMMAVGPSFGSLFAVRLLLGVFEASITPVFVIMTGMWYQKHEQAKRLGIWYSGSGMANVVGGLIAWGIAAPTAHTGSLTSWQLMYVVFGCLTVLLAFIFFFVVPDSQLNTRFLSTAEKVVAIERIRVNQQGIGNRKFKWCQVRELMLDPRTYIYFIIQFVFNIGTGAITTFGSLVITSMGYSKRDALIQNMPLGAAQFVAVLLCCFMADRMKDRNLWALISSLLGLFFGALCYGLTNNNVGSLVAFQLQAFNVPTYILTFGMVSENTAGHTKKVLTNAILLLGSTSGTLTGPQITKNDPTYRRVKLAIWVCPLLVCFFLVILRAINVLENRRRDRAAEARGGISHVENSEFMDLTDGENPEFRYSM